MSELLAFLQSGQVTPAPPDHLERLAQREGLNAKALKAITIVECGGKSGFDDKKRPVFLFEPHHFYKFLPKDKRDEAIRLNLARKKWDKTHYNAHQKTFDTRWALLAKAAQFHNDEAAVGSCSWGPAQIVAHLWAKKCGYESAAEFVKASLQEQAMLEAFIKVLLAMNLRSAIKNLDFRRVAEVYNGPGQAQEYAKRMKKAFDSLH
jgi:hypothetical protein